MRLRMRNAGRDAENVFGQIVDAIQQTAAAGDENALAEIIRETARLRGARLSSSKVSRKRM